MRRRNLDFVGEPVYVRAVKATCGPEKDSDVAWYALEMHFENETITVDTVLRGKPQGDPEKYYVGRVGVVKYQTNMKYADYWEANVENEVGVRMVPHLSHDGKKEELWAVPADLPVGE